MACPVTPDEFVEQRMDRILTQYRESPKLLHLIRTYLRQIDAAYVSICDLPSFFEIDTAVGDQLTLIGKRLGWPRCHCVCIVQPVFGFACEGFPSLMPLVGFCENNIWEACGAFGIGEVCIDDDEVYRGFLRARRYQMLSFYDIESLTDALQAIYGETARVLDAGNGRVVLAPGRDLTVAEDALLQLVPRVLPVAPGIRQRYHFGPELQVFGFGEGWGGFCDVDYGALLITTETDNEIETEDGSGWLSTGSIFGDAPWMCEIDVKPYDCA